MFLETVVQFIDVYIPYIGNSILTASNIFGIYQGSAFTMLGEKKFSGPPGIEPATSELGIRNANITPVCSIYKDRDIHSLYVLASIRKCIMIYFSRIEVDPR